MKVKNSVFLLLPSHYSDEVEIGEVWIYECDVCGARYVKRWSCMSMYSKGCQNTKQRFRNQRYQTYLSFFKIEYCI